jgi:pyruvate ferredoxin oxidoreductase alpha subunit
MAAPGVYMEMRRSMQAAMESAPGVMAQIEDRFSDRFGRRYGSVEAIGCEGADVVLITSGTVTATARVAVEELRQSGERVGLVKIRTFRPFPAGEIRRALAGAAKAAVIDRNFSVGASGIFAQEVRAALCNEKDRPQVFGYVAGLGGRDVTVETIEEIYNRTREADAPAEDSIWIGLSDAWLRQSE